MPFLPIQPRVDGLATPAFTASPVERTHSAWMLLWPFQSRRQLRSTAAFFGGGMLAMALFLYFAAPQFLRNCLIGAAIGGIYCGVYRCLPARMTLATRGEARHFVPDLQRMILSIGYRQSDQPPQAGRLHFCNNMPRWLSWDEQDLAVCISERAIQLVGPVAALEMLRARLLKDAGV